VAAPASSRGATTNAAAGLSGGCRGPQVRSVATAQAKRRVELPICRRRLERTEALDRRKGGREAEIVIWEKRRADRITHEQRTSAAVCRLPSGLRMGFYIVLPNA